MKKTRLLIALLVMLVAASGYAQDSYRQAVKDYLTVVDQFEKSKSIIPMMSKLFVGDDQVDVDQLTKRYLDERFEDDITESFMNVLMERNMSEAEIKEVTSMFSMPEGKNYLVHQQEWMTDFLTNLMMSMMSMYGDLDDDEVIDDDKAPEMVLHDITPNADIDAAYAARFNEVLMESDFGKNVMAGMMERMNEVSDSTYEQQEYKRFQKEWMTTNVPTILLNSAYGNLTLEDLDFAAKCYANEAYRKLESVDNAGEKDKSQMVNFVVKYTDWMKEQGAKVSDDPTVAMEFINTLLGLDMDNINNEPKKPWYDFDLGE